jgi:hypothetical protein
LDLDQALRIADKAGAIVTLLAVLVMVIRGDLVPKYVVSRLEKELDERRKEDRDEERLAERSLSVTERTAILAADMVVDIMRNESGHRTRNRNRQDREDEEDRQQERRDSP